MSQLYPHARELFATAALDWTGGTIKAMVLDSGFVPDFTKKFLSDVNAGSIIATSGNITSRTAADGVCDGDTINFGPITDPRTAASLLFFKDTGTPSTSPLIAYYAAADVLGFPVVLNGYTYYLYKNVAGGWFAL
jgi:hypothetical protein